MKYLEREGLARLLRHLSEEYDLFVPQRDEEGMVLRRVERGGGPMEFDWNEYRVAEPLKGFWFQPAKIVARWGKNGTEDGPHPRPRAVFGAKACDLKALEILDRVFAEHGYTEPHWCRARESNLIVSGDCTTCGDSCFCTMLGGQPHPEAHFDLNLCPSGDGFLVETGSAKGEAIVAANGRLLREASPDEVRARDRRRRETKSKVEELNARFPTRDPFEVSVEKNLNTRIWGELAATCVECNACNLVCPTCHCFLLQDMPDREGAARVSLWDSCFRAGYARMAGGLTPRLQLTERFKNHYFHKFVGFPRNWGITACSGCGRCIDACMGRIDKRRCLHELETRWIPSEAIGDVT